VSGYGYYTGFVSSFRSTFSPCLSLLPVTTTFSSCPFVAPLCFNLAAFTRSYNFPDEVSSATLCSTEVKIGVSQIAPKSNYWPIVSWSLAISWFYCFKLNPNFQHLCCIVHERILESIYVRWIFRKSFFVWRSSPFENLPRRLLPTLQINFSCDQFYCTTTSAVWPPFITLLSTTEIALKIVDRQPTYPDRKVNLLLSQRLPLQVHIVLLQTI